MHKHRKNSDQNPGSGGITQEDLCINVITILKRRHCGDVEGIKLARDRSMMVIKLKVPQQTFSIILELITTIKRACTTDVFNHYSIRSWSVKNKRHT